MTDQINAQINELGLAISTAREQLRISEAALAGIKASLAGGKPLDEKKFIHEAVKDESGAVIHNLLHRVV